MIGTMPEARRARLGTMALPVPTGGTDSQGEQKPILPPAANSLEAVGLSPLGAVGNPASPVDGPSDVEEDAQAKARAAAKAANDAAIKMKAAKDAKAASDQREADEKTAKDRAERDKNIAVSTKKKQLRK